MIKVNNKYYRNLEEQVQFLTDYHDVNQGLVQWGIKVVGQVESESELPMPYDGAYGDAIAVGTQAPFFFYIWTRPSIEGGSDYWFPFGEISIVGPQGPQGDPGEPGEDGESSMWYAGSGAPQSGSYNRGDMYFRTNGDVFRFSGGAWQAVANIKGPQGIPGIEGPKGEKGDTGAQGPKGETGDVGGFINIYGILDNIGQLPLPTELQNLTVAYLVGASEPYDLYVQIGSTSGSAIWTNVGPFNAATLVTVGGAGQNVWDADTKVDKVQPTQSGIWFYTINTSGETVLTRAQTSDRYIDAGQVILGRSSTHGTIEPPAYLVCHTPSNAYHVANKTYVDTKAQQTVNGIFTLDGTTLNITTY